MIKNSQSANLLSLVLLFVLVSLAFPILSMFRLIGIGNIPWIILSFEHVVNVFSILFFLLLVLNSKIIIRVRRIDFLIFLVVLYPIVLGVVSGNVGITFFNDSLIFTAFIIKIIIVRSILINYSLGNITVFSKFQKRVIKFSITSAVLVVILGQIFIRLGYQFYFQTPAEVTLAASISIVNNQYYLFLFFLLYSIISGKRMIFVGVLVVLLLYVFKKANFKQKSIIFLVLPMVIMVFGSLLTYLDPSGVLLSKINSLYNSVIAASENTTNIKDFFSSIDIGRTFEVLSLWASLDSEDLILGTGYGYRYEYDSLLSFEGNVDFGDDTITNAHFSPIAVISKFGLVGFSVWSYYIFIHIIQRSKKTSKLEIACRFALISLLFQSLFSFGFFINMFTPVLIAMLSVPYETYSEYKK